MESNEREPSYYEVALTHRQLMVGLVVALTTVVVAFFAGIWIGRGGGTPGSQVQIADAAAAAGQAEQLTFFGEQAKADRPASKSTPIAPKPAVPGSAPVASPVTAPAAAPIQTPAESDAEALRKTLEEEMAANRVDAAVTPAVTRAVAPGARVTRDASGSKKSTSPAPTATAVASGTLWIQVYSSTHRERASEISARLKKAGFAVRTLEPNKESGPNYRVRVGPYADRGKADLAASRLRREFKLDTWVTDTP